MPTDSRNEAARKPAGVCRDWRAHPAARWRPKLNRDPPRSDHPVDDPLTVRIHWCRIGLTDSDCRHPVVDRCLSCHSGPPEAVKKCGGGGKRAGSERRARSESENSIDGRLSYLSTLKFLEIKSTRSRLFGVMKAAGSHSLVQLFSPSRVAVPAREGKNRLSPGCLLEV